MDKNVPCYGCDKRRCENGYNCHSDCPEYKEYHDKRATRAKMIREKRYEEAMINDVRFKTMQKVKRTTKIQTAWKG